MNSQFFILLYIFKISMVKKIGNLIEMSGKCAPGFGENYKKLGTCVNLNELQNVASIYNANATSEKSKIKIKKSHNLLYKELKNKLKCDDDHCIVNQIGDRTLLKKFKPKRPETWFKDERTWLNTLDIINVMKQYELKFQDFNFLGVFPIDFMRNYPDTNQCIVEQMCDLDINQFIDKKIKQIGFVLNLDKHDEPGSHWVSVYANIDPYSKKFGICYYDSIGRYPSEYVLDFIHMFKNKVYDHFKNDGKLVKKFKLFHNFIKHQFKYTECGMFCMIFLIVCLENTNKTYTSSLQTISKYNDDDINKMRKEMYI